MSLRPGSIIIAAAAAMTLMPVHAGAAEYRVEAGLRVLHVSGGTAASQGLTPFPLGRWHNDDHLWWTGGKPGDRLDLALPVKSAGRQRVSVVLTRAPDYGIVQFSLDGRKVAGHIDLYSAIVTNTVPIPLSVADLSPGDHTLSVEIVGANEKAAGEKHMFGIDRIILESLPDEAPAADSTALVEELYCLDLLPRLRPGVATRMFSSYDRTGGNNDGFSGNFSQLWIEDGNSVLASMSGAGCIQRIWFTHSEYEKPGLLGLKREHIRIYVDGQPEPSLDVPLEDLLSGKLPRFPKPLVGEGQGGFYCYVPIAYRQGCKLLVEGTAVRFYQITYRELPAAQAASSFRMEMSPAEQQALRAAADAWARLGHLEPLDAADPQTTTAELAIAGNASEPLTIPLPAGPRMVRAVYLDGLPAGTPSGPGCKIQFRWDGAQEPSAELPLEYFFGQALNPPPYRSLLVGVNDGGWYNFMPMPYGKQGAVTITANQPLNGRLRVVTCPLRQPISELGYFHAVYNEDLPTQPDRHHVFARRRGAGHYMGTYLVTQGTTDRRLPLWLEGDDRFTVDGELVIHGTGSEDYFNCGWYAVEGRLDGPGSQPVHGFPVYGLVGDVNQAAAYRWHVGDPVHYDSELTAEMEHGADNRQPADYRSAAFFYESQP